MRRDQWWVSFESFPLQTPIRCHLGWFLPQCQHTTAPPSFATSAWSHPLQHKHNMQETSPAVRIISPCSTTQLLSSCSPSTLPRPDPSLKLLSDGSTHWPLAGHPLLVDGRLDQDLGEPRFPFTYRDCGPAALTYLLVWCAFKRGQLAALRGPSSCYHGPAVCLWPAEKSPQHLLVVYLHY